MERNKKKKILFFMLNPNGWRNSTIVGGGEIISLNIINKISEYDWTVITSDQTKEAIGQFKTKENIKYIFLKRLFSQTNYIFDIVQGIYLALSCVVIGVREYRNTDLLYSSTTNFSDYFPAMLLSVLTRKPLVSKYHISLYTSSSLLQIYRNYRKEKNGTIDSLIRSILAWITLNSLKFNHTISVSNYLNAQLVKCGVNKNRLYINRNGLDFGLLEKYKSKNIKKEYDYSFMGRIEEGKGIIDFIKMVSVIKTQKDNVKALVIGNGSFLENAQKYAERLELQDNIYFTGFLREDRYKIIQQSRTLIAPSYTHEGFGLSIIEALFLGLSVVAYDQPVLSEIFSKYPQVYLVKENTKNLVDAALAIDVKNSKTISISEFSIESTIIREKQILDRILQ